MSIYLDYAATAPLRGEALEAMMPYLKETFGNPDSLHAAGRAAARAVTDARDKIAETLGVKPREVYFTSGGTEADNWAVRLLGRGEAVLSPIEHAAVLSAAPLREGGYARSEAGEDGAVTAEQIGRAMTERTGLVCAMSVNNETGCIQPVREIAALAHAHGALFFSDCVQAACTLDLKDVLRFADAISLSAHKAGGPKGVGALIVREGTQLWPLIAGGEQERGLRGGTVNVAGAVGFACALALAQAEREAFCARTGRLRDLFEGRILSALGEDVRVNGDRRAPNISNLSFRGASEALLSRLDLAGIEASGGAACSAHAALPSHVLLAMGRSEAEARRTVRFSFGRETSEENVLLAADAVIACVKRS